MNIDFETGSLAPWLELRKKNTDGQGRGHIVCILLPELILRSSDEALDSKGWEPRKCRSISENEERPMTCGRPLTTPDSGQERSHPHCIVR